MAWRNYKGGSKYGAKKVEYDGITFDSKKEAMHYGELRLMEKAGIIQNLQRQVKYILIPAQYEPDIIGPRGGHKRGALIERECAYIADFVYESDGKTVVEDVKGMDNLPVFVIKRKLMLEKYGIRVKVVK